MNAGDDRFLVALLSVQDLLFSAKDLFVAAMVACLSGVKVER
jgi:hypothetical protein